MCWAERGLAETIRAGVDRIRLVQVSDFKVGTIASSQRLVPGDGDVPIARILGHVIDAGYAGVFDLELIGAAITAEGYDVAVPRAVEALGAMLTDARRLNRCQFTRGGGPHSSGDRRGPIGIGRPSVSATREK